PGIATLPSGVHRPPLRRVAIPGQLSGHSDTAAKPFRCFAFALVPRPSSLAYRSASLCGRWPSIVSSVEGPPGRLLVAPTVPDVLGVKAALAALGACGGLDTCARRVRQAPQGASPWHVSIPFMSTRWRARI